MKKRIFAFTLVLCLALTALPGIAFAIYSTDGGNPSAPVQQNTVRRKTIDVWYEGGNVFCTSKSDVPTAVEIDGEPVGFSGDGSRFTVSCVKEDSLWITVRWDNTSAVSSFIPDENISCSAAKIPKTGDVSAILFAAAALAAAGAVISKKK